MIRRPAIRLVRTIVWLSLAMMSVAPRISAQQPAPDNTAVNKRDRDASQPTADQQKNNRSDVAITRDIRRALANDKHLSTYARNIKVITQHGDVTLKGPVRSDDEKQAVEAKAVEIAGADHVKSEVSIKPAAPKSKS